LGTGNPLDSSAAVPVIGFDMDTTLLLFRPIYLELLGLLALKLTEKKTITKKTKKQKTMLEKVLVKQASEKHV